MEREAAEILAEIKASSKYAHVADETVLHIIREFLPRYKKRKDALKAIKTQLHIIHGAFYPDRCHGQAMALIGDNVYTDRELSLQLMELHPSTRERLPALEEFYLFLAPYTRDAKVILDVGCGFHPCAFPFMGLSKEVLYRGGDIDHDTVEVVRALFQRLQVSCDIRILDAARESPAEPSDAAFLFKLIPVLEQQKKGLGYKLLASLRARHTVVTFPVKSLSGKKKEMEQFYSRQFEENLPGGLAIVEKKVIGMELVYIVAGGENVR
jgi:16S rRNA (guanine(1405)-N(7))-methyltransferase